MRALALLLLTLPTAVLAGERVLVFTRAEGFRHDSIEDGVAMLRALALSHGWTLEVSDDPSRFTAAALADVRAVVWLNTTGDVLDPPQQDAFSAWLESGGGYVGIHAAADCEYGWPWYGKLLGNSAWFESHPAPQAARVQREDAGHPSTEYLPDSFVIEDEWYNFRANPRSVATVLLHLDESSYAPGAGAMQDHPISWSRNQERGRVWYTGMGHSAAIYDDPRFVAHVAGGVRWVLAGSGPVVHADGFEPVE